MIENWTETIFKSWFIKIFHSSRIIQCGSRTLEKKRFVLNGANNKWVIKLPFASFTRWMLKFLWNDVIVTRREQEYLSYWFFGKQCGNGCQFYDINFLIDYLIVFIKWFLTTCVIMCFKNYEILREIEIFLVSHKIWIESSLVTRSTN